LSALNPSLFGFRADSFGWLFFGRCIDAQPADEKTRAKNKYRFA